MKTCVPNQGDRGSGDIEVRQRFVRQRDRRPTIRDAEEFLSKGHWRSRKEWYVYAEERKRRLERLRSEMVDKLRTHLPRTRNLDAVVLKCHILLEFMMNQFIDLVAPREGVIDDERFTFKEKQALLHMLGFPPDPLLLPTLDTFNRLRNQVAHTLEFDVKLLDELIRMNSEDPEERRPLTDGQRASALKQITRFLCWRMLGIIEGMHNDLWEELAGSG